ncbi:nocobactin polyketide synthase NbtC [Mycobacteroides salmoniphilum]|uniref:nocobactin polyketide synthase NbtC n=1 Tax=Mycobacteroides salmoniphilum TaxID=404941 RepID=UPI001F19DF1B|nr:nocobactin polyketide synthase NbtC [Mycobacteroides salmoniphilum]
MVAKEASAILTYALEHPHVSPNRIADMLFRTRIARRYRTLLMVRDRDELLSALQAVADGRDHPSVVRGTEPANAHRIGYVFPGQGGQRPGMGRAFYEAFAEYRAEADRCSALFEANFGQSPLNYLLNADTPADDSASVVQPALFTQMVGLAALWRSVGVIPDVTVGHSQGEIAAAYVSGMMSLADAVTVVGIRAGIVDAFGAGTYAMAVAAADRDTCEELLARRSGWAEVSVINSPSLAGISGDRETIQDIVESLTARGVFARVIPVQYPAHTSGINAIGTEVSQALRARLSTLQFDESEIDCLGATLGAPITADLPIDQYWFWNLRNPVRFDRAITAAARSGADTFVELAEHPALQLAIQENLRVAELPGRVVGTSTREGDRLDEFTLNLAQLMVHDLGYQWELLQQNTTGRTPLPLLDFPNVQTNDITLWLPYNISYAPTAPTAIPNQVSPSIAAPETDKAAVPARLLKEDWVRLTKRTLTPPRAFGIVDHTGECAELAAAMCSAADDTGSTARIIDPGNSIAEFEAIVVLLPERPLPTDPESVSEVTSFFGQHTWWPGRDSAVTDYWLVTVGGEAVVAHDPPPHPVHAAASAGFRSIGAEYPGIGFRHLDLTSESAQSDSAKTVVMALHTAGEPELALRGGTLYAKRAIECDTPAPDSVSREHVLVVGGTGKLGLEFCEYFSQRGARRVTLVSRSGETASVTERLSDIRRKTSTDINVVSCDISDEAAVARLAELSGETPADLIIHAAVDYSDIEFAAVTNEKVDAVLQAKILGISHVLRAFPRTDSCRIVLCSSMAATIAGRGQTVYAAANRMLDAMAHRLRSEGLDCVSVQWGQWAVHFELGESGAARLAATGVHPMRPAEALALGMSRLQNNAIVVAFDVAQARSVFSLYGYGPLLSGLQAHTGLDRPDTPERETSPPSGDVRTRMIRLLSDVIGNDRMDTIDTTVPMVALGVDSLQALEFRRRVIEEFHYEVEVADLLGGASVDDVIASIDRATPSAVPQTTGGSSPTAKQAKPLTLAETARQAAERAVPQNLDIDRMRSARRDLDLFGMHATFRLVEPVLREGAALSADDIAEQLGFAPRHGWLLRRWLEVLTEHGHLSYDSGHGYRVNTPIPSPSCADIYTVCADLGYPRELAEFMGNCNERLADLGQDRVSIQELLFRNGDMVTVEAAHRDNLASRYVNLAAREVVTDIVSRLHGDRSPVRILELGAGTGSTTGNVVAGLNELSAQWDYHFTDVSRFFLNAAQGKFGKYPQIRFGLVDMNIDLVGQSYDIVIAENSLHNALDIGQTLLRLYDAVNPGGVIVLIESCKANYQVLNSVKFLMSAAPGQPHPGESDIRHGARIFLSENEWNDQLSRAGFRPLLTLPEAGHPTHMLDQRIIVAERN